MYLPQITTLIWHCMFHIVEKKAENYKKLFIVQFHQNRPQMTSSAVFRVFFV